LKSAPRKAPRASWPRTDINAATWGIVPVDRPQAFQTASSAAKNFSNVTQFTAGLPRAV
jgi:hypothetical protein